MDNIVVLKIRNTLLDEEEIFVVATDLTQEEIEMEILDIIETYGEEISAQTIIDELEEKGLIEVIPSEIYTFEM